MKLYKTTTSDKALIKKAAEVSKKNFTKSRKYNMTVGSALLSKKGKIYFGVDFDNKSDVDTTICSEMTAIAKMIANKEKMIDTIVAVENNPKEKKYKIITPCGNCQTVLKNSGNPYVIISDKEKIKAKELYACELKKE